MTQCRRYTVRSEYSQGQPTESLPTLQKIYTRVIDQNSRLSQVIIEVIAQDASGKERLAARSAPLHPEAAKTIAALCDQPVSSLPFFDALQKVLCQAGPSAWATAKASGPDAAAIAAREACRAIKSQTLNRRSVLGLLVVTTLSTDSRFVEVIKTVLNTVRTELPSETHLATAVNIDNATSAQVRVQLLVTGLQ